MPAKPSSPPPARNSDRASERLDRLFDLMDIACDTGVAPDVLAVMNYLQLHDGVIRSLLKAVMAEDADGDDEDGDGGANDDGEDEEDARGVF